MLCLCVIGDPDVDEVLRGDDGALAGMAPGGIVVIHSTVHPDTCRIRKPTFRVCISSMPRSRWGPHGCGEGAVGDGRGRRRRGQPVPAGAQRLRESTCPPGEIGTGQTGKLLNNALSLRTSDWPRAPILLPAISA